MIMKQPSITKPKTFYEWVRSFTSRELPRHLRHSGNYACDWLDDARYDAELPKGSDPNELLAYMHRVPCEHAAIRAAIDAWCLWWNETHWDEEFQLATQEADEDEGEDEQ